MLSTEHGLRYARKINFFRTNQNIAIKMSLENSLNFVLIVKTDTNGTLIIYLV